MATVTYKTPGLDKKTRKIVYTEKTGDVAIMQIGPRRVKCVLQRESKDQAPALVHYASGNIIIGDTRLNSYRLMHFVNARTELPWRRVAEIMLASIINEKGHERVLSVMDAAPVINV